MRITPKNWVDFQHYRFRSPPWIKLHRRLLDDAAFQCLHVASKALAPMLWLLASETKDGVIDTTLTQVCFRLRLSEADFCDALRPLIVNGFFKVEGDDASALLASCLQGATTEYREREKEEDILARKSAPKKPIPYTEDFERFWKAYPTDKNMPKKIAFRAWKKLTPEKRLAAIGAVPGFRRYCEQNKSWYRVVYADRFLSQEKFEGYAAEPELTPEQIEANKDRADRLMKRGKYAEGIR